MSTVIAVPYAALVESMIETLRTVDTSTLEFPLEIAIENPAGAFEVEIDRCARCGVIGERNGEWKGNYCPRCTPGGAE